MLLPAISTYDPAIGESGRDPLGLEAPAARISGVYLPGITSRMSRTRAFTLAAVSAHVCDPFVDLSTPDGTPAYLVFEWLWATAMAGLAEHATRGIPGIPTARGVANRDEFLFARNYIKGAAAVGVHGAYRTLARSAHVVDSDGRLGSRGITLLDGWSRRPALRGFRDGTGDGGHVLRTIRGTMSVALREGRGQKGGSTIALLREFAAPDLSRATKSERSELRMLLLDDAARACTVKCVEAAGLVGGGRSASQRVGAVITAARRFAKRDGSTARSVADSLTAFLAFEALSEALERGFDLLRFASWEAGRSPVPVNDLVIDEHEELADRLPGLVANCGAALTALSSTAGGPAHEVVEAFRGVRTPSAFARALLARHDVAQAAKGAGGRSSWFQGTSSDELAVRSAYVLRERPSPTDFVHPDRVTNLVYLLEDLA